MRVPVSTSACFESIEPMSSVISTPLSQTTAQLPPKQLMPSFVRDVQSNTYNSLGFAVPSSLTMRRGRTSSRCGTCASSFISRPNMQLRKPKLYRRFLAVPMSTAGSSFSSPSSSSSAFSSEASVPQSSKKASKLPVVAVVGRPNVGKSTLVNRLAGTFRSGAIVEDVVGITRDRTYRPSDWNGYAFSVVDTGGLVFDDQSTFFPEIRAQALVAIQEASVVLLCVDGQSGVNPLDIELASFLRREVSSSVAILIAVNKCESHKGVLMAAEFWELGLGEPFPVSAIHGAGTGDLLDKVVEHLPFVENVVDEDIINIAIVGRPNVGKSSLLNVLLGRERVIVSEIPGTTRDTIDEIITVDGKRYRLIDTAGIRRRTSVDYGTEMFMVNRAFRAIRRADVVVLLLDVGEASDQDRKIADRIKEEGKACIVLANKWDLVTEKDNRSYNRTVDLVRDRTVSISWAPVELISVIKKQRVGKVMEMADKALEQHRRRISTAVLNEVLRDAVDWHKPPSTRQGKQGRIYYCTQVSTRPPTLALFVNDPRLFQNNYRRYMEGQFRKALGFEGTPLRIFWRGKSRPPIL